MVTYTEIQPGEVFRHYKGGKYEVVTTAQMEHDKSLVVVYRSKYNDAVWVRPLAEFIKNFRIHRESQDG